MPQLRVLTGHGCGDQRGGALVEFAVLVSAITILLVGAIDFGRVYFHSISVANAAHSGAQYGTQTADKAKDSVGIEAAVREDLGETPATKAELVARIQVERYCECPDESKVNCETGTCSGSAAERRTFVRVRVDRDFRTLVDYPGVTPLITVSREVHMRAQ